VPVATSYLHIALIEGVGEQILEIGGLGGGFGLLGEVFNCERGHSLHLGGGALVTVSLRLIALVSGVLPGLVCLACPYIANQPLLLPSCCV
jgi:hypothetical protein